jgi:SAM-dependent methyltransferase
LTKVRGQRSPFEALSRRLIADTLERYLPAAGPIVEIGMGDGQLRDKLPEAVVPRLLHTEPQAALSRAFRRQHPSAVVLQAPAERLPFDSGMAAAVVGLCVMDVVPDGAAVARELSRVLRPGGRFIHWLDMSTVLGPVVASLSETGLVPFPNVFTDPIAGDWPEDLFLVAREQLALIVAVLQAEGHALARPLGQYLSTFSSSPFGVGAAVAELVQLQESSALRSALKGAFRAAHELASPALRQQLSQFQGRPVSSARHFEQRLRAWFGADSGFRIEQSGLTCLWESTPRAGLPFGYTSCCVGEQRLLPSIPEQLLCSDAMLALETDRLAELGVFVFVAGRI